MKPAAVPFLLILWIGSAALGPGANGSETAEEAKPAAAKPAEAKPAEAKSTESAQAKAEPKKEFKPPPGFVTKKRGKLILYCKRDTTIGTRFKTEKCYDEAQMRDYMLALQENKRDIDRIRSTCSNICTCGQPGSC